MRRPRPSGPSKDLPSNDRIARLFRAGEHDEAALVTLHGELSAIFRAGRMNESRIQAISQRLGPELAAPFHHAVEDLATDSLFGARNAAGREAELRLRVFGIPVRGRVLAMQAWALDDEASGQLIEAMEGAGFTRPSTSLLILPRLFALEDLADLEPQCLHDMTRGAMDLLAGVIEEADVSRALGQVMALLPGGDRIERAETVPETGVRFLIGVQLSEDEAGPPELLDLQEEDVVSGQAALEGMEPAWQAAMAPVEARGVQVSLPVAWPLLRPVVLKAAITQAVLDVLAEDGVAPGDLRRQIDHLALRIGPQGVTIAVVKGGRERGHLRVPSAVVRASGRSFLQSLAEMFPLETSHE